MKLLILNGVNINLIGSREPDIYGDSDYAELVSLINSTCEELKVEVEVFQSNFEGEFIEKIQTANCDYLILNPGAWSHYSYAIRDALLAVNIEVVEVHLSNPKLREEFRKFSVIEDICIKTISGLGFNSYVKAIKFLEKR